MTVRYVGTLGSVVRGGTWNNNSNNLRVANRNRNDPTNNNNNIGFRCSRSLPPLPGQDAAHLWMRRARLGRERRLFPVRVAYRANKEKPHPSPRIFEPGVGHYFYYHSARPRS
jgi:hypothetical protein